MICGEGVT